MKVLQVLLTIGETSAPYNEHCLAGARRHDISVCSYFAPTVAVPGTLRVFAGDGTLSGFFRGLRSALDAGPYDVVHAHAPHVALGLLGEGLRRMGRRRAPRLLTVHTSWPNIKLRNRLLLMPPWLAFDRLVCCSQASLDSVPRALRALAGRRAAVVANGVDLERVDRVAARPAPAESRPFTIVVIGRLMGIKNPLLVLEAFRRSAPADARLVFIGDGPMRGEVEARRGALGSRVVVRGLIPREDVYRTLKAADLLVSASTVEGLPVAVLEAMACSCPVVLSDIAPHREIVGGAGFIPLVAPDDLAGFAGEIERFGRMAPEARAALGAQVRALVEARFSLASMAAAYDRLYEDLAGGDA